MTNYLASAGIQYVSITIPTSATSNTATITTVGSGAFVLLLGQTMTGGNPNTGMARVTLTNSTTVTATRNTSSGTLTTTINCVVVDGNTTTLIKSVQFGTITFSTLDTSLTATISSVNTSNTAVAFLGYTTGASSVTTQAAFEVAVKLTNATTVTADKQGIGQTTLISFCAIEFQGAALNQAVQQIDDSSAPAGTSRTVTVTSVNVNNAMLIYGGCWSQTTSNATGLQRGTLTNGTTVTITTNTGPNASVNFKAVLVEFISGVLNQAMQRGALTITAGTTNTATITSVNTTNAALNFVGNNTTQASALATSYARETLTNSTTITATNGASATTTTSWEVVEFSTSASSAVFADCIGFGMTF